MNLLLRMGRPGAVFAGAVALAACSPSSSSSSSAPSAETTAAKVASERADAVDRLEQSAQLVTQLGEKVPDRVAARARCLVVIPSLVKAGIVVGGQSGKGFATCETAKGWSAPAPITIGGGTLGAQLGVASTELLALVTSEKGMNGLMSGNFKLGVDASATAGPVGTGRGSSTDVSEGGDLVSYSRSKGLFAGANLEGSTITADEDTTRALYGSPHDLKAFFGGSVTAPNEPASQRFLSAVRGGFGKQRSGAVSSR
jgi:SH3 domain-containing YSC84-like protein 1